MKKIAAITASVLALGAASIAAGADGTVPFSAVADVARSSVAPSASAAANASGDGAGTVGEWVIEREIRLVTTSVAPVNSCDAAYWPYYPADCLKRVENAGH